jgi:amino acid adenylation domain-containing protein
LNHLLHKSTATSGSVERRRFEEGEVDDTIPSRFAKTVGAYSQRKAVVGRELELSYQQLDEISDRIAHAIRTNDKNVADTAEGEARATVVMLSQGVVAVAAILGALKAGTFYVPIDPNSTSVWLEEVCAEVRPGTVLTDAAHLEMAEAAGSGAVTVDIEELVRDRLPLSAHDEVLGSVPDSFLSKSVTPAPDSVAYVFFTSGTTGEPKGVIDSHRNVLHNIMRYTNAMSIGPSDRLTLLQSIGFSGTVSSLFSALLNGACIYPVDLRRETGPSLAGWLQQHEITIYHSVPSLFRTIARGNEHFPAVRVVRLEGDQASTRDVERFREHFPRGSVLVNGLGTTETGIVCQYFMDHDTALPTDVVPIGYPCEGMEVLIVGQDGSEAADGEIGEIAVRSRYLATGYWNRPELTGSAFTPVRGADGVRMYRTGDQGRRSEGGLIEHLGRVDARLRLHGRWVEIAVVEEAVVRLPGIREAVVGTYSLAHDEKRLAAYVVTERDQPLHTGVLRTLLAEAVPIHAIPSRFVKLDQLPLSSNGKTDRSALPPPARTRPHLDVDYVRPFSSLQQQITELWSDVLGIDVIGIRDDFFELGGDSVLAMTMLARLEELVHRRLPPDIMLRGATVEYFADALLRNEEDLHHSIVPINAHGDRAPLFFLHGDYVSGGFYAIELARLLGSDQPFYAIPPCGMTGGSVPSTYAAMAERHIEAMKTVQPQGPYVIAGTCNGGLVGYEMARLLAQRGEEVSALLMIDSSAANLEFREMWTKCERLRWLGVSADLRATIFLRLRIHAVRFGGTVAWRAAAHYANRVWSRITTRITHRGADWPIEFNRRSAAGYWSRFRGVYLRIDHVYFPGEYGGRVVLLWPDERAPETLAKALGWWQMVCPQIEGRSVPGDYHTCLTQHAGRLAEVMREVTSC